MKKVISLFILILIPAFALADDPSYKSFGKHKVFFSAFNSSFISPDIAETYKITRGKDKGMVNIAVIENDQIGGVSAEVTGTVSNIFAQQQSLTFFEVREGNSVYYLAPFSFENEDFLTFKINVKKDPQLGDYSLSFQRTFYHEE